MWRAALAAILGTLLLAAPAAAAPREVTLRHGPIEIGPYAVRYATAPTPAPRVDGAITRMHARVVDRAGRPLPVARMMLHHVVFVDLGRRSVVKRDESYCPGRPGRRFYGTGEEDQTMVLPPGYGYPVHRRDRWAVNWMLMNHGPAVDRAYVEYTMTIDDTPGLVPVTPHWIGVVSCRADPIFNVPGVKPPGWVHTQSRTWRPPADGRIVAGGGHLHGGSLSLDLRRPGCAGDPVLSSRPLYGAPEHPYYNVLPVLHEPGPISASWTTSPAGIPVRRGERLRIDARYDASRPHVRAMGIMHVYVAPPPASERLAPAVDRSPCPPRPPDVEEVQQQPAGRGDPPVWTVPLTGIGPDGRARVIERPPGRTRRIARPRRLTIDVRRPQLLPGNLDVPAGTTLRWRFDDATSHDVTVADGPSGFASPPLRDGADYTRRLTRRGVYKLMCSLHPAAMTQRIVVR